MSERLRLFLLLALGETVLTTGTAIAGSPAAPLTILAGAAAFVAVASLWALFFGGAGRLVEEQLSHGCDSVWAARMGANGQYVVLAGLIAVGCELVVAHPTGPGSLQVGLLLSRAPPRTSAHKPGTCTSPQHPVPEPAGQGARPCFS